MKYLLLTIFICTQLFYLQATNCQSCPFDNDNGGGGSGGYNCGNMGSTIYVDSSRANNNGSGTSWATAKKYLRSALDIANNCDQITTIYVAKGTYTPNITSNNRDLTFFIGNDIDIQGGYPPGGGVANHVLYPTILKGEITPGVEVYHIMTIYGQAGNINISGFVFKSGFADGTGSIEIAPGIFMARDDGAAVYLRDNANVYFKNCAFYDNVANDDGGAIFSHGSITNFINAIFSNNTTGVNGGGLYIQGSSTSNITNCTFANNFYVSGGGGAIYNTTGSTLNIYNSIIWGNSNSWNGGGVRNIRYTLIQDNNTLNGGISTNNIFQDPEFDNVSNVIGNDGNFFTDDDGLLTCRGSIAINRGLNTALNIANLDITSANRIYNEQVDLGPYELQLFPTLETGLISLDGDSTVVRVYAGRTGLPTENCSLIALLEPDTAINSRYIAVAKRSSNPTVSYNAAEFVRRYYYLQKFTPGEFEGKIYLYFTNSEFLNFNNNGYSINDLPTSTSQSAKYHLRVVKFPGITTVYNPQLINSIPEIINPEDDDITYNENTGYWRVAFHNAGELGTFFITTTYNYIFNNSGQFSDPNNWNNNIKPNGELPSFNKININQGVDCIFNEPLILKPYSEMIVGLSPS